MHPWILSSTAWQGDQGSPAATDHYLPEEQAPSPPEIAVLSPTFEIITQTLLVSAAQAHLWDACIRDPRNAKAASSDINVHTNMSFEYPPIPNFAPFRAPRLNLSQKSETKAKLVCVF